MGRWVTSKGRRIYIPDEGEENPFVTEDSGRSKSVKKATHNDDELANERKQMEYQKSIAGDPTKEGKWSLSEYIQHKNKIQKLESRQSGSDTKEKQIAANKKQSLSKMNTNELRDLAVSLGADKKRLYGTSKDSMIFIINQLRKKK